MWQKIKAGIEAKLAAERERGQEEPRELGARRRGKDVRAPEGERPGHSDPAAGAARVADTLVLSKIRHALGFDKIKIAACGAAATPIEVLEFFLGLGIEINEVWGMSETTGASTTTCPAQYALGTVGKAVDGRRTQARRRRRTAGPRPGDHAGYRNDPEKTAETIDVDGWLPPATSRRSTPRATSRSSTARRN